MDSLLKTPHSKHDILYGVAIVSATLSVLYSTYKICKEHNDRAKNQDILVTKQIPMPGSRYPLVGHLLSLGDFPGKQISKWHQELGPIIQLKMGRQTWIMIDDPELAHKIFVTNGAESSYRSYNTWTTKYYSANGLGIAFSQPGHQWNKNRAAALTVLAPKQIDAYLESVACETLALYNRLRDATIQEGGVDPIKHFELVAANVILTACFGRRFNSVNDPEFKALAEMGDAHMVLAGFDNDLTNFVPILSIVEYFAGTKTKMENHVKLKRDPTYRRLLSKALATEGPNLVKSLKDGGFNMTDDEMLIFTSDLIIGATDTTSVTLAWICALLCHHPNVQTRMNQEIDAFVDKHGTIPSFKQREELPFCLSVIKECMRFRPLTPFGIPHSVQKDIIVDGYKIPKGASLVPSMDSMHVNPKVYTNPDTFNPERFLNNTKSMMAAANGKLEDRDHYNFGWGRRLCPGIYLAEAELFYTVVQIFARAVIVPKSDLPDINVYATGLTTKPSPYNIKFIPRSDARIR